MSKFFFDTNVLLDLVIPARPQHGHDLPRGHGQRQIPDNRQAALVQQAVVLRKGDGQAIHR